MGLSIVMGVLLKMDGLSKDDVGVALFMEILKFMKVVEQ